MRALSSLVLETVADCVQVGAMKGLDQGSAPRTWGNRIMREPGIGLYCRFHPVDALSAVCTWLNSRVAASVSRCMHWFLIYVPDQRPASTPRWMPS